MKIIDKLSGSKKYTVVSLVLIVLLIITSTALAIALVGGRIGAYTHVENVQEVGNTPPQAVQYNDNTIVSDDLYNELQVEDGKSDDNLVQTSVKLVEINNFLVGQMKNNSIQAVENSYSSGADSDTLNNYKTQIKIQLETLKGYDETINSDKMVPEDIKVCLKEVYSAANALYESIGEAQLSSYNEFVTSVDKFTSLVVTHVTD